VIQYILQLEINNKMVTRLFSVRLKEDIANAVIREVKKERIPASRIVNNALRDYFFNRDKDLASLRHRIDKVKKLVSELDSAIKTAKD